jgi:iron complex outermembrane recepter protein
MPNRKLAHAVRLAMLASGATLCGVVAAQDAATEELVVTGTRIPDANFVATSPVATVTAEDFRLTGTTRVEDLLNRYPQMAPSFDAFTVNPTTGFPTANLRGLGTTRTLVLVNGQRLQPGGIRGEARDLNQVPAALVRRVEVLTGGASVVYGSDAMAGVVNFILDTEFEGLSVNVGASGYQHDNSSSYMQGLMDNAGFTYPSGSRGGGETYNMDLALGSRFDDGRGHAMAYLTWRENREMRQGTRDYSSCALDASGTVCGGSSTSPIPSFFVSGRRFVDGDGNPVMAWAEDEDGVWAPTAARFTQSIGFTNIQSDGTWATGTAPLYNYAPINHYQRPDERWTFGGALNYDFSPYFQPFVETMFTNTETSVQIAESGTFFVNSLTLDCASPELGTLCTDLAMSTSNATATGEAIEAVVGVDGDGEPIRETVFFDPTQALTVQVGKRNNEGGPRISDIESSSYRFVVGSRGEIMPNWSYEVSAMRGRTTTNEANRNDFLADRVGEALLACYDDAGALTGDPSCYNVWIPGGVTVQAAEQLGGVGMRQGVMQITGVSGFVTGITDWALPTAQDTVSVVVGAEWRKDEYSVNTDTNMATGNFTGLGGPRLPISGDFSVAEFFVEAGVPVFQDDDGLVRNVGLDLGYRYSNYDTSGGVNTWKIGASAQILDMVRLRGGFNRAIRAANVNELFSDQQIALWSGADPCAGEDPEFTQAQCANTGVSASQYGLVPASPASQYNHHIGGNPDLDPEKADTWTIGLVATPILGLTVSLDYFDIFIEDRVGTIGASTVLRFCGLTGDPFLCDRVNRGATGDLWVGSDLATSGYVENLNANFGEFHHRGLDFQASYSWDWLDGTWRARMVGTYVLEDKVAPLPGVNPDATYDCAGRINISCQMPEWKHRAELQYNRGGIMTSLGWRHVGEMRYRETNGSLGTTDLLLVNNGNKLDAYNYFDLSGSWAFTDNMSITAGVANIFDKRPPLVGSTLSLNANSPGGYDQMGRFLFGTFNFSF